MKPHEEVAKGSGSSGSGGERHIPTIDESIILKERMDTLNRLWIEIKIKEHDYENVLEQLACGTGAREVALAKTALQESRHWLGEALDVLQNAYLKQTIVF